MRPEIDLAVVGDLAFNHDVTPVGERTSVGGAAYYSAVGAAVFSDRVGVVARIGEDFDTSFLTRKRIDTEGVGIDPFAPTCRFILIQHPDNTREFSAERGAATVIDTSSFPDRYLTASYIHLATSLPEHYITWIRALRSKTDATISVDTFESFIREDPARSIEAIELSDLLFINEDEAGVLAGLGGVKTRVPWVLKKGAGGVEYIEDGAVRYSIPAPRVRVTDTTGAGDVLAGAFLAQRAQGVTIPEALERAVRTASASVTDFGVEHVSRKR